jgi:hypothetical protein
MGESIIGESLVSSLSFFLSLDLCLSLSLSLVTRGIVHKPQASSELESENVSVAASGQLTGLAEDQDVLVHIDQDARNDQSYANSRSHQQGAVVQTGPRILREIVQESTERWMLANDGADDEYYREMSNMGYEKEG